MSTKYCFSIPDVFCPSCAKAVKGSLISKPSLWKRIKAFFLNKENANGLSYKKITLNGKTISISDVWVNLLCKQITVTVEEDGLLAEDVMSLLNVELIAFPCNEPISQASLESSPSAINSRWLYGFTGVGAGFSLLVLPFITGSLSLIAMVFISVPSVLLTLALGAESYKRAAILWFKEGELHMDTLFSVSTLVALAASITALFFPSLPMMFETGLLIFGFRHIGEAIRESLEQRMGLKQRFQDRIPEQVKKIDCDEHVEAVPTAIITIDDLVLIEEGDLIAFDGVCEKGVGFIDRSIEFGWDKDPRPLQLGDKIRAGMILTAGSIQMRVLASAKDSLLAKKDANISSNLNSKDETSWKTEADRVLHYFIPMVFGLAILSGVVVGHFLPLASAIQSMVAVLVSACPCTLGLVTGLAVRVGMKKAADHNMEFKSTRKLEEVDQITRVVFDVNGTLTTTFPEVTEVFHASDSDCRYEDFLKYALILETDSSKSVGMAIYHYAKTKLTDSVVNLQAIPIDTSHHSGVKAVIDGMKYVLGDQNMMKNNHVSVASYKHRPLNSDETIMYIAREQMIEPDIHSQTILGHFILRRPLRAEAKHVVNALRKMGKEVYICTGSNEDVAFRYAAVLGVPVENVRFLMSSDDKMNYIKTLQDGGRYRVAMIGDDENDTDPITASDFGVAMPTDGLGNMNHRFATAESRIHSLEPVVAAFEISRQMGISIRQNLMFSWGYNIAALILPVALLLVTGVALSPGVCVALMILQTSMILLNTYWFKQQDLVCLKQAKDEAVVVDNSSYGTMASKMPAPTAQYSLTPSLVITASSREFTTIASNEITELSSHRHSLHF